MRTVAQTIQRWQHRELAATTDLLAVEEPLEIRLGFGPTDGREQRTLSITMRTPGHDEELAAGFLITEGIVKQREHLLRLAPCTDAHGMASDNAVRAELSPHCPLDWKMLERHFYTTSSCGVCGKASLEAVNMSCPATAPAVWPLSAALIAALPQKMRDKQGLFEHTGALHAAAIFDSVGNLELLREDVGRHNAVDKCVGALWLTNALPATQKVLMLSGRIAFELVQKAAMSGIKTVCAVGAPTSLAVQLAHEQGITLIGFVRGERFNVYSHAQRISN